MKKLIIFCIVLFLFFPVFSQDAAMISLILSKEKTSYMDFSYMIASQMGLQMTAFEAYTYCDRYGNFRFTETTDKPILVKTVSHFLVSNYNLKGGIMWSAFKNPRYAFKELKSTGFWPPGTDPDNTLTGRELIRQMSKFFTVYPDAQLQSPPNLKATEAQKNALLSTKEAVK